MSKILVLDIETSPSTVYTWGMYDVNISPDQIIEPSRILCVCAHWVGSKSYEFYSLWDDGEESMLKAIHALLNDADAVVTYNGQRFDLPRLQGEFMLAGLPAPPPPTSIDLLKVVKKLGFVMNKLAYIAPLLNVGNKIKHEGFNLWKSVLNGDPKAQNRMMKYCIQDVKVTTRLYETVKHYITDHPNLGEQGAGVCGNCGSDHFQKRGFRRTKYFKTERLQCQGCGSWSTGSRSKV